MKSEEKKKARELRKQGCSIKNIARELGVAKSSVSMWTRDIELTEDQIKNLWDFNKNPKFKNANKLKSDNARSKRKEYQIEGMEKAKEKEWLHSVGCMLYWAEGYKSNNKSCVSFSNSDLYMLKLFIKFLLNYFNITINDIKWKLNCYTNNGYNVDEIVKYWTDNIGLKKDNLGKVQVNKVSKSSKNKRNTLSYGTVHIVLDRTDIIQHIYGAIQEYGGFERKEYLG